MSGEQVTIMAVHAHPDDEVVFTGGTLLLYRGRGVRTVLVTATGGEEGEIHDPDLDAAEAQPRLRDIRREELRKAVDILAIDAHEMLGYRDSGMAGTEANKHPDNFHNAGKDEATARLVELVRRYKPQILITYDENGAYGHPDHIACNVITTAAYERAGDPSYLPDVGEPWQPLKLYFTHWPEENWKKAHDIYTERGLKWPFDREDEAVQQSEPETPVESPENMAVEAAEAVEASAEGKAPAYVPPAVTSRIDVRPYWDAKRAAILVHRTQFDPNGGFVTMPDDIARVAFGEEDYSLVRSRVQAPESETDLLAGLD